MSTIRKHPYTETLMAKLSNEQITTLLGKLNGSGTITDVKLWDKTAIAALGAVSYVRLEYLPERKEIGFLINVETNDLVLLSYIGNGPQFHITYFDSNDVLHNVDEYLDTEELRRIMDDTHEAGGDAWIERMKEVLDYDEENHVIENGTDVYIDGTLEVDDEAKFNDHFSVFADNGSRMIDANTANKTTSLYGTVNVGSTETATPLNVRGTSSFYGNVHNESGFIETNELKVNQIKVQDTPEGQRPTVNVTNADLKVDRNATIDGDVTIGLASGEGANTSDVQIHGDLQVHKDIVIDAYDNLQDTDGNELLALENIKDGDGNNRFIEGSINITPFAGLTTTYSKWSLSGSHLTIVICGSIDTGTYSSTPFFTINLPSWISDKITPIAGDLVNDAVFRGFKEDLSAVQNLEYWMSKNSSGNLFGGLADVTTTYKTYFRIECNLLIDNA